MRRLYTFPIWLIVAACTAPAQSTEDSTAQVDGGASDVAVDGPSDAAPEIVTHDVSHDVSVGDASSDAPVQDGATDAALADSLTPDASAPEAGDAADATPLDANDASSDVATDAKLDAPPCTQLTPDAGTNAVDMFDTSLQGGVDATAKEAEAWFAPAQAKATLGGWVMARRERSCVGSSCTAWKATRAKAWARYGHQVGGIYPWYITCNWLSASTVDGARIDFQLYPKPLLDFAINQHNVLTLAGPTDLSDKTRVVSPTACGLSGGCKGAIQLAVSNGTWSVVTESYTLPFDMKAQERFQQVGLASTCDNRSPEAKGGFEIPLRILKDAVVGHNAFKYQVRDASGNLTGEVLEAEYSTYGRTAVAEVPTLIEGCDDKAYATW